LKNVTIGVFDSGLGGLTVLKELLLKLPLHNYIYLGDTARLPYGSKSPDTIKRYLDQSIVFLKSKNVDAIVVACNSASSVIQNDINYGLPIFGVIDPSAKVAVENSFNERVAIIATRTTVKQKSYVKSIQKLNPLISIYQQACPLLVPLVEEGLIDDPITNLILYRYINPLLQVKPDCLILGCTHYPLLLNPIRKVVGNELLIISSAESVIKDVEKNFPTPKLSNQDKIKTPQIYMTDESYMFENIYKTLFPEKEVPAVEIVNFL
jgi:glutamate racemase